MSSPARVVIVGRPNVGKSSLFNQLVGRRLAIVEDKPGVTRDRLEVEVELDDGHAILLTDTGGMGLKHEDATTFDLETPINEAIQSADVFIIVVDARAGLVDADERAVRRVRGLGKPMILLANKADTPDLVGDVHGFWSLGIGEPVAYSVNEKWGLADLRRALIDLTPRVPVTLEPSLPRVAILGKRNSGKSTLLNFLSRESRVIVSDVAGTTRDFVECRIEAYGKSFVAIDTAGLKRPNWDDTVDFFSNKRSERILRECDAVIMMLDGTQKVTGVDKKLAAGLRDLAKPVMICVNKWDLAPTEVRTGDFMEYLDQQMPGISYAPVAFISALMGDHVKRMIQTLFEIVDQGRRRLNTAELNRVVEEAVARRTPPSTGSRQAKILYASQVGVSPPTFVFKVNDGRLVTKTYRRYLENQLREAMQTPEIPLKLSFQGRSRPGDAVSFE